MTTFFVKVFLTDKVLLYRSPSLTNSTIHYVCLLLFLLLYLRVCYLMMLLYLIFLFLTADRESSDLDWQKRKKKNSQIQNKFNIIFKIKSFIIFMITSVLDLPLKPSFSHYFYARILNALMQKSLQ